MTIIKLKDGTELNVTLNGTTYESKVPIPDGTFMDDNLSEVTIDGVLYRNMVLISSYPWNDGTRFALREMTEQEIRNQELQSQVELLTGCILEMSEILYM